MRLHELIHNNHAAEFKGVYRLTGRMASFDESGQPFIKIRLSCCHSDFVGIVDPILSNLKNHFSHLQQLSVSGIWHYCGNEKYLIVKQLSEADEKTVDALLPLHTLPRIYCPEKETFDQLIKSVRQLESSQLRHFICKIIARTDKLEVFLNAPASQNYHHAQPGGLLAHSLEVAHNVLGMIQLNEPSMPRLLKEAGFVAGLLHDIGKTYTCDKHGRTNPLYNLCSHDSLTLEACANGLAYLDKELPEIASMLRHIWTCSTQGTRYGYPAAMTIARYVRDADGQSAMRDNQYRALKKPSKTGFGKIGNNRYWLPKCTEADPRKTTPSSLLSVIDERNLSKAGD